jgi:hypothetical protein
VETKTCKCCGKTKPPHRFPDRKYGSDTCKACYAGKERLRQECVKNARVSRLLRWPAPLLLVVAIFSHDYVDGRNRICFYESIYGQHAITIDALRMCPLTIEVDGGAG